MNCTTEQPDQDVGLRVRWPGAAAVRQRIPLADEALLVIVLWAVFPVDHVLGDQIEANTPIGSLSGDWPSVLAYFGSIAAAIAVYLLATAIGTWWSGLDWEDSFTRFAYAYLPFAIVYMIGNHVITGLLEEGGALLNAFFGGLGVSSNLPEALASQSTIDAWVWFNDTILPWLAVLWGVAIVWYAAKRISSSDRQALQAIVPHVVVLTLSTAWIIGVFGAH